MSSVIQRIESAIALQEEKLDLLKNTFFKGATNEEFKLFVHACERTGLDPFMRQIYPVKRWDSQLKKECMTIQTGIDGYRLIADRTGRYSPGRESSYQYDANGKLLSATAYVKKQSADGTWHEVSATAFYEEYVQRTKMGEATRFWQNMPHNQLAKCAEALALRKAFPAELSGIYTKEEMEQADVMEISPKEELQKPTEPKLTEEQAQELDSLYADCDPEFVKVVLDSLRNDPKIKAMSLQDAPARLFERLKNAAFKNRDEYLSKKQQQEEEIPF